MRTNQPAPTLTVLEGLLADPHVASTVVHHFRLPARPADLLPLPPWLDDRVAAGLQERGITSLYRHQAEALEVVASGGDVVVVTPTASGKSLCYVVPILHQLARDPASRSLLLFPTKALGQDQVTAIHDLATASGLAIAVAAYDGDTPAPVRSTIRRAGHVVVTNPDMLHGAILPHHTKWFQLFENLRFVVIDELHVYRGVFGSHVANVLRRLWRVCAHYGVRPQVIATSATIGNPGELAHLLTSRQVTVIDRNGAPAGERHLLFVVPEGPVSRSSTAGQLGEGAEAPPAASSTPPVLRRDETLDTAARWALPFLRAGRQTIVFTQARLAVELVLRRLREALADGAAPPERLRGYRSGYLPRERRAVERGLRSADLVGVVSTNALELGVDVGGLHVAVLAGYPGSVAATWQRLGRAGRRGEASVGVLIAGPRPIDHYVVRHPEFLLERSPEEARIDPDNLHILFAHLKAATFELPFQPDESWGALPASELLAVLAEDGHVHRAADGRWYWSSENFPAAAINLRRAAEENVVIVETGTGARPRVIGEVDLFSAQALVHDQAIYIHESTQYHVDRLDWAQRTAYVRRVEVDYYTTAQRAVTLKPLDVMAQADGPLAGHAVGEVMVASRVGLFKKLSLHGDEPLGWGPVHLPEIELQTTAYWLTLHGPAATWPHRLLDVALRGAGRILQAVASLLLMVEPADLGLVTQVRSPHQGAPTLYLYEGVPGGIGLADRLFQRREELLARAAELVAGCRCSGGCPACVGPPLDPDLDGKALAARLLADLAETASPDETPARTA
jgi:DEAD/DEAH box helicase domain-containing protein